MRILAAFMLLSVGLWAQADLATVTGLVTDAAGAVMPGVAVTVRNLETGAVRSIKTTPSGDYVIASLPPGSYELTAEAAGFRKYHRTGIVLEVGQTLRDNIGMQIGTLAESVEVTAEAAPINTERGASMGEVIVQREIQELPLMDRDFMDLAFLVPGVVEKAEGGNGSSITANGARADNTNMYVDGFSNRDSRRGIANSRPNIDAVQEFKMETSGYSAEYGRLAGGVVGMALRSGANRLRGALFESLRNKVLDARGFFDPERLDLKRNQFGATFSGPVLIPGVYNGRNRTFFLGSYEGYRQVIGESAIGRVPTAAERAGDLSGAKTAAGAAITVRDPLAAGSPAFPNNRIPASRFSPISAKLLDYFPLPNRADPVNNFVAVASRPENWDSILTKIDHRLSQKDTLAWRYSKRFSRPSNPWAGSDIGTFGNTQKVRDSLMGLDYMHMFSPAVLMEVRGGYARTSTRQRCIWAGQNIAGQLGIPGSTTDPELLGFPRFTLTNYLPLGCVAAQPAQFHVTNIQANAKLTWVRAGHTFKWGFDAARLRHNEPNNGNARGTFAFQDRWTGYPMGDMLLGLLNSSSRLLQPSRTYLRATSLGLFFSDDYRAARSLTLNLGLRYELESPVRHRYGQMSNFVPGLNKIVIASDRTLPNLAALLAQAGLTNVTTLARDAGLPESLVYPDYTNFAPRFGFAWRPLGAQHTVLRGGYGIFYAGQRHETIRGSLMSGYPFSVTQSFSRVTSDPNALTLANPFPAARAALGAVTNSAGFELRPPTGYMQSYNLAAERDLGRGAMIEVGYVGSKGSHLVRRYDINQPLRSLQLYQAGIPFQRPYAGLNTIDYFAFGSDSVYNAGQVSLRRRSSGGLFYRVSYTYGKSIDEASQVGAGNGGFDGAQDSRNLKAERGRSDWDRGHAFTAAFAWPLPIGRGRAWLKDAAGALGAFVNGWQLSGTTSAYTGAPFTVLSANVNADLGESQRPNRLGKGVQPEDPSRGRRGVDYPFFRLADFEAAPRCESVGHCNPSASGFTPFSFGNAGRNILDGMGTNFTSAALMKNFPAGERKIQFRCEAFNAFNRTHFRLPVRNFNAANGGRITAAAASGRGGPRVVQLTVKFEF
ncbi:MAG: carboxypeptidase regulatory-like domain-containing protein [Bryobacteraceae bacterium]